MSYSDDELSRIIDDALQGERDAADAHYFPDHGLIISIPMESHFLNTAISGLLWRMMSTQIS